MAASPLIAIATSLLLGAGALDRAANRLADRLGSTSAFSFIAFGGVGSAA